MGSRREILERAKAWTDFPCAKVKVGSLSIDDAIATVRELKSHFSLRIDVNGSWTRSDMERFCAAFSPSDFEYLEDPSSEITSSPFPLATDEIPYEHRVATIWKPHWKGPPPRGLPGKLILSSVFESGVGIAQIVAAAAQMGLPQDPIGIGTYAYLERDILVEPLVFSKGKVYIPSLDVDLRSPYVEPLRL
jgi:O-succinylbenzoate synthase